MGYPFIQIFYLSIMVYNFICSFFSPSVYTYCHYWYNWTHFYHLFLSICPPSCPLYFGLISLIVFFFCLCWFGNYRLYIFKIVSLHMTETTPFSPHLYWEWRGREKNQRKMWSKYRRQDQRQWWHALKEGSRTEFFKETECLPSSYIIYSSSCHHIHLCSVTFRLQVVSLAAFPLYFSVIQGNQRFFLL